MQRTVGICTLGCKVNQYESTAIAEALSARGFAVASAEQTCDAYIVNTCTVTAESDRKARQMIRRMLGRNPNAYVLVTGCLAQTDPDSLRAIRGVDFVCGNRTKLAVVDALVRLFQEGAKPKAPALDVPSLSGAPFEPMSISHFDRTRAYIKIEDGCENHCTYCAIPAARGTVRSKPLDDVVAEVRRLTENGCREIVLTGIETASWGRDLSGASLADLLEAVDAVDGIGRVRLGSLDPSVMRPALVERIARLGSLAPHFHLSIQSGCSRTLAKMRRKYNRSMALEAVGRMRDAIPDVTFSADIIVGFPGETDEDFAETLDFCNEVGFLHLHIFPYSKRKGTEASVMPDQIPDSTKKSRLGILENDGKLFKKKLLSEYVNSHRENPVYLLVEKCIDGYSSGHREHFVEIKKVKCESEIGEIIPVYLDDTDGEICTGHVKE